jgi:hypothetical protein
MRKKMRFRTSVMLGQIIYYLPYLSSERQCAYLCDILRLGFHAALPNQIVLAADETEALIQRLNDAHRTMRKHVPKALVWAALHYLKHRDIETLRHLCGVAQQWAQKDQMFLVQERR